MENNSLLQRITQMRQSLLDEGILDQQFIELEEMADEDTPNLVEEVMDLYFDDTERLLAALSLALEENPVNFDKLEKALHHLKGNTTSVGAREVGEETSNAKVFCRDENLEGVKASFQKIVVAQDNLKDKLKPYFQLVKQASSAGAGN